MSTARDLHRSWEGKADTMPLAVCRAALAAAAPDAGRDGEG